MHISDCNTCHPAIILCPQALLLGQLLRDSWWCQLPPSLSTLCCAQHLAEQLKLADTQRETELQRQAQYMAVAAAEAAVGERVQQSQALDQACSLFACSVGHRRQETAQNWTISRSHHRLLTGLLSCSACPGLLAST